MDSSGPGGQQTADIPTFGIPSLEAQTTGNLLVLLPEQAVPEGAAEVQQATEIELISSADFPGGAVEAAQLQEANGVVFDQLGVALVRAEPGQVRELAAAVMDEDRPVLAVEEERVVHALAEPAPVAMTGAFPPPGDYLRGYRDAVNHLVSSLAPNAGAALTAAAVDESKMTWGLQHTGAVTSQFSGQGVRVAVLDTGATPDHPDFLGRKMELQSFIAGEEAQDGHGHGTHCIGTACGPRNPDQLEQLPAYGIAFAAEIYAGKVLSNAGSGTGGSILAGINWAVTNGCRVASMSLGAPVQPGQTFSAVFEQAAQRAMAAGTLIIAAAGNDSRRSEGIVKPVSHPANCPSIMSVAALDVELQAANFSNGTVNPAGGQVDIGGPGVRVHSSWPMPTRYRFANGTSMATPHVAGIAALYAQANPQVTAGELFGLLMRNARRLPLSSIDAGSGLVQAP
jgi:subtilisin family serine protease